MWLNETNCLLNSPSLREERDECDVVTIRVSLLKKDLYFLTITNSIITNSYS